MNNPVSTGNRVEKKRKNTGDYMPATFSAGQEQAPQGATISGTAGEKNLEQQEPRAWKEHGRQRHVLS